MSGSRSTTSLFWSRWCSCFSPWSSTSIGAGKLDPPSEHSDMSILLTESFLTALIAGAVTAGVPLLLAGLGEQISEKAGVLNIGIEGMMLLGAYVGFVVTYETGSFGLGFLGGGIGGLLAALIVLVLCIRLGLNQIVIGIAVTIGAQGLTSLLHYFEFSREYPRLPAAPV